MGVSEIRKPVDFKASVGDAQPTTPTYSTMPEQTTQPKKSKQQMVLEALEEGSAPGRGRCAGALRAFTIARGSSCAFLSKPEPLSTCTHMYMYMIVHVYVRVWTAHLRA